MDELRNGVAAFSLATFSQIPSIWDMPFEKISVTAILAIVVWVYLNKILPKTNETITEQNKRMNELCREINTLNTQREKDQQIIERLTEQLTAKKDKE